MTKSNAPIHKKATLLEALLGELRRLLPLVSFSAQKGSYVKGETVCVLVDNAPSAVPGTFDAGVTVFPLADGEVDRSGIEIVAVGTAEGNPNLRPIRRKQTNHRGNLTFKEIPAGSYRLLLSKSVVTPSEPIPPTSVQETQDFALRRTGSFASGAPPRLLFRKYRAADGSLTCTLRETSEGEVFLYFESPSPKEDEPSVEYVIVEEDTEKVVIIEREGEKVQLGGRVSLNHDAEGHYSAQINLGSDFSLPKPCYLRAYLVPGVSAKEDVANGGHGSSGQTLGGGKFSGGTEPHLNNTERERSIFPGSGLG